MTDRDDEIREKEVKRVLSKAFTALLKAWAKEPVIVFENNPEESINDMTVSEINSWLFKRS